VKVALMAVQALTLGLAIVLSYLGPSTAAAQEAGQGNRRSESDVRDTAGFFSTEAIYEARRELRRRESETGASVVVETIDSLEGDPAEAAAMNRARRSGIRGLFVLIARKEHKIEVLASREYRDVLTDARREKILTAFTEAFRRKDLDEGLKRGVAAIGEVLAAAHRTAGRPSGATAANPPSGTGTAAKALSWPPSKATSALVVRNQVRLTLAGARAIVAGAETKAQAMGLKVNIAVVDDGGHLLAFERMDGARPASAYTALTKATTAATLRAPSGPPPPGTANPDPLLNLSLQNAALASGGKITTLHGGVPVVVESQVIGGVGVGGGTGEQDAQIARAGIEAFSDQLANPSPDANKGTSPSVKDPVSHSGKPGGDERKRDDGSF
jgi:glc operon protein GlcG